jgi:MFS family permease
LLVKENQLTEYVPLNWKVYLKSLIDPLIKKDHQDFKWVWITRALVMLGFYIVQPNLYFYLRDVIKVPDPDGSTVGMILLVLIGATITGLVGGHLSEKIGRKPIVYAANGIMAAMAMAFPFCTGYASALTVAIIFGLGYGAYVSVDWALGTDVLPDKAHAGKDMAVWHVAMVFPQAIAAPVAGYVLRYFGTTRVGEVEQYQHQGFQAIFAIAAVFLVLGAVLLRNVKGAR